MKHLRKALKKLFNIAKKFISEYGYDSNKVASLIQPEITFKDRVINFHKITNNPNGSRSEQPNFNNRYNWNNFYSQQLDNYNSSIITSIKNTFIPTPARSVLEWIDINT
jgi:hypothetical protein